MMGSALRRLIAGIFAGIAVILMATSAFAFVSPRLKPPAPGPTYLASSDHDLLLEVSETLKRKRFSDASHKIAGISNPIAKSLGEWMYFMAEDPRVSLQQADAFLDLHEDWPAKSRIQSFVESRIPKNAPVDDVLAFFESRDPVTGPGKVQLARALFAKGEQDAGEVQLRDAWVNDNFTVSEERALLSSYGGRLTEEDHAARVDRLLWARQVTNARRIFSKLDKNERNKAKARAALLLRASSAPSLYSKLSKDEQLDSGVLLAAVRYYRRTGNEIYAISLASKSPKDPEALRNSARWWYERRLLMRWALKEGRFSDAYTAAANHGLEPGGSFAEAEFAAGWIALRFLNEPTRAETHFLALASSVGTPISLSRAFYWLGRTAAANGNADLAAGYYQSAAKHYYSYYGQLAAEELGGAALDQRFSPPVAASPADKARFGSRATVAALRMLSDLNLDYEFMVFSYHIDDQLDRPGEFLELASLTNGEGAPHLTVRAGKVAIQRNAFTPEVAYPLVFVPEEAKRFVSPEIVLGLSRQESEFNPRAYSRAGARGVMQLIPSTAQITAQKEGLTYSRSALLDDPVYNMTIGSAHLSHLMDRFDGSLILTFAAYNAGAARADQWIASYGDPRLDGVDPVDWVELIPFSETRNYVQRVLENIQVYRGRLNDAPIPGRLSADLERGGAHNRVAHNQSVPSFTLAAAAQRLPDQKLTPLPDATVKRATQYRITRAAASAPSAPPAPSQASEIETTNDAFNSPPAPSKKIPTPIHQESNLSLEAPVLQDEAIAPVAPKVVNITPPETTPAQPDITESVVKVDLGVPTATVEEELINAPEPTLVDESPASHLEKPAEPPISILELPDAPAPLNDKPAPVAIEEFIARVYAPRPNLDEDAPEVIEDDESALEEQ